MDRQPQRYQKYNRVQNVGHDNSTNSKRMCICINKGTQKKRHFLTKTATFTKFSKFWPKTKSRCMGIREKVLNLWDETVRDDLDVSSAGAGRAV